MKYLQKLGKSLMIPVAVLPAAAIIMGIAYFFQSFLGSNGLWVQWSAFDVIGTFMSKAGGAVIDNMAALFAIGLAFGMSKDQNGAAALSGFVAFMTVIAMLTPAGNTVLGIEIDADKALALSKINNPLTGILSGIIASLVYNKYYKTILPNWLSFFNGKRLVPIITSAAMMIYVIIMYFIWPAVFGGLVAFGEWMVGLGAFGAGIFGVFNRLLIPFGLHHALNNVFWFDTIGIGDLTGWLAGVGEVGKTGMYQAGFFPVMMGGLPAACLAMVHTAKPENRERVKGIMISAATAAIIVGITEPIEFSFMFVAPALYGVHAVLTGISLALCTMFEAMAGFGFSAGLVDLLLSFTNPLRSNQLILVIMILVYAVIYYFLFRFMIVKFNFKTPGREDDEE